MTDYILSFPVTSLDRGVEGFIALRNELTSDPARSNFSALGDPRDAQGNIIIFEPIDDPTVPPPEVAWYGRPGIPATNYTDLHGNIYTVPARGDPSLYYVHIRSEREASNFKLDAYEMKESNAIDSAAVLGIWFGDEVPK